MLSIDPGLAGLYFDLLLKSFLIVMISSWAVDKFDQKFRKSTTHAIWALGLVLLALLPIFPIFTFLAPTESSATSYYALITFIVPEASQALSGKLAASDYQQTSLMLTIYSIVVFGLICRLIISWKKLSIIRSSADYSWQDHENGELLERLQKTLDVNKTIKVGCSRKVSTPISFGFFNPCILLPPDVSSWDSSTVENVLLHELGHIKRHDWLISLISYFFTCVNWMNPIAWYLRRRLVDEAEYACDSFVVQSGRCPAEYAGQLLELARRSTNKKTNHYLAQAIVETGELTSRIQNILVCDRKERALSPMPLVLITAFSLSVIPFIGNGRILVIEDQSVVQEAVLLQVEEPVYPARRTTRSREETAQFRFNIDKTGNVIPSTIYPVLLSGYRPFDQAAAGALRNFKFEPMKIRGQPTISRNNFYMFRTSKREIL